MPSRALNRGPFFLVYDSRSGSTLLANLMAKHLGAILPPEARYVVPLVKATEQQQGSEDFLTFALDKMYQDDKFVDWGLDRSELLDRLREVSPLTAANITIETCRFYGSVHCPDSFLIGLKKGEYLFSRKLIKSAFPSAKFVAIVRDGRAVFGSKKTSTYSATNRPFETNPFRAAETWVNYCSELEAARKEYPGEVITIKYEDLVQDHVLQLREIADFLEIEFRSEKGAGHQIADRYRGLHDNVDKEPLAERIAAWRARLSAREIEEFESIAIDILKDNGYVPVNPHPRRFFFARKRIALNRRFQQVRNMFGSGKWIAGGNGR